MRVLPNPTRAGALRLPRCRHCFRKRPVNARQPGAHTQHFFPETNAAAEATLSNPPEATLQSKLEDARTLLNTVGEKDLTNAPAGVPVQDLWTRRAALQRLVRLYEQELSNVSALEKAGPGGRKPPTRRRTGHASANPRPTRFSSRTASAARSRRRNSRSPIGKLPWPHLAN